MVTELIFENIMADMDHTEIAAVLSCIVFEQKNCSEPDLPHCLTEVRTLRCQRSLVLLVVRPNRECCLGPLGYQESQRPCEETRLGAEEKHQRLCRS